MEEELFRGPNDDDPSRHAEHTVTFRNSIGHTLKVIFSAEEWSMVNDIIDLTGEDKNTVLLDIFKSRLEI